MYSQIDAVFNYVSNFLNDREAGSFTPNETHVYPTRAQVNEGAVRLLDSNELKLISAMLVECARAGMMKVGGKNGKVYDLSDTKEMTKYCDGLLRNHLRRDKRLNGGTDRKDLGEVKRGPRDAKLSALSELLKQIDELGGSDEDRLAIESAIAARKIELAPAPTPIERDLIPAELQHLIKN